MSRVSVLSVAAVAAVVAGCSGADSAPDVAAEQAPEAAEVAIETPRVVLNRDVRGGPLRNVQVQPLDVPASDYVAIERGRVFGVVADSGTSRWRVVTWDLADGQRLWDQPLPEWHQSRPSVVVTDEIVAVYGDRPNPQLAETQGGFDADNVPSRIQQIDAFLASTGETAWSTGPLPQADDPEQVPDRATAAGGLIVAGEWAVDGNGHLLWQDRDAADLVFARNTYRSGSAAVSPGETTVALDVATGETVSVDVGARPVAVGPHAVFTRDRSGTLFVHYLDGSGAVEIDVSSIVDAVGERFTIEGIAADGNRTAAAAVSNNAAALFSISDDGTFALHHAGDAGRVSTSGRWVLSVVEASQSETRLHGVRADGQTMSFQVIYPFGQGGSPHAAVGPDGLIYLTAGNRMFAIDPDNKTTRWETTTDGLAGPISYIDVGVIIGEDHDGTQFVVSTTDQPRQSPAQQPRPGG